MICPIMSKPYFQGGNPLIEVECLKEECAAWVPVEHIEKRVLVNGATLPARTYGGYCAYLRRDLND